MFGGGSVCHFALGMIYMALPLRGYRLPAKHVIHAVGPFYTNEEESAPLLENAYRYSWSCW